MARPQKIGVDYYSMDVEFFNDIKIKKLLRKCGGNGVVAYIYLLNCIYADKGYYIKYDDIDDLYFDVADRIHIEEEQVKFIIEQLLILNLFDRELFNNYRTLTSKGIQKRYIKICEGSKRINLFILPHLDLTKDLPENISSVKTIVSSAETPINSELMPQRKGKERKEKERKEEERKEKERKEKEKKENKTEVSEVNKLRREFSEIEISEFEEIFAPYTQEFKNFSFSDIFTKWQVIRKSSNWTTKTGKVITDFINDFEHFINLEITFWRQNEHQRKAGIQSRSNGTSTKITAEEFDRLISE